MPRPLCLVPDCDKTSRRHSVYCVTHDTEDWRAKRERAQEQRRKKIEKAAAVQRQFELERDLEAIVKFVDWLEHQRHHPLHGVVADYLVYRRAEGGSDVDQADAEGRRPQPA